MGEQREDLEHLEMAHPMAIIVAMRAEHADNTTHGLVDQLGLETRIRGDGVSIKQVIDINMSPWSCYQSLCGVYVDHECLTLSNSCGLL